MSIKSADDLIIQSEANRIGQKIPDAPKVGETAQAQKVEQEAKSDQKALTEQSPEITDQDNEISEEKEITSSQNQETETEEKETHESNAADAKMNTEEEVDEYGTKVGKKKVYTEEEVQRMIRERLSRGQFKEQATKAEMTKEMDNFSVDQNSEESWETQLEQFIENTLSKVSAKRAEVEWRQKEEQKQAEFEARFTQGMSKYKDFKDVVENKPITNSMMMAARTMNDPAAFIYAASKNFPQELDRIAKINDPYAQMTEVGRLEERMRKAKKLTSAPKPGSKISGDMVTNEPQRGNIDQLIDHYAKSKVR